MDITIPNIKPRIFIFTILIVLFSAKLGLADAKLLQDISTDLRPLNGFIVSVMDDEYLVDLDKSHGVQIGDLFSVIKPGEKVVHPNTGKQIGVTKEVSGVLKITSIQDGFSYAKPLTKGLQIEKGDLVIRYEKFEINFYDYTGKGIDLYHKIQKELPTLMWNHYEKVKVGESPHPGKIPFLSSTLIFVLYPEILEIRDFEYTLIKSYSINSNGLAIGALAANRTVFKTVSTLPSASVIADFIKLENRLLLASTNGLEIKIIQLSDTAKQITVIKPSYYTKILSVKWWQPDRSKPPYIAATIWADKKVEGVLYRFDNNLLHAEIEDIPKILGTFDLDGDFVPETLLGQNYEGETFFGQKIEKLTLRDNKLESESLYNKYPRRFTVLGSAMADLTGDGTQECIFIRNSILYIYSEKELLYKSAPEMGGSVSFLTYDVDSSDINSQPATVSIEVSPIALDADQDGQLELFAVASRKSIFGKIGTAPGIEKSNVSMIDYKKGRFVAQEIGDETELSIQGLFVSEKRLLTIGTMTTGYNVHGWTSYLLSLRL